MKLKEIILILIVFAFSGYINSQFLNKPNILVSEKIKFIDPLLLKKNKISLTNESNPKNNERKLISEYKNKSKKL